MRHLQKPRSEGFLRITVGTEEQSSRLIALVHRLISFWADATTTAIPDLRPTIWPKRHRAPLSRKFSITLLGLFLILGG
jgi:hypothetical protein